MKWVFDVQKRRLLVWWRRRGRREETNRRRASGGGAWFSLCKGPWHLLPVVMVFCGETNKKKTQKQKRKTINSP